MSPRRLRPQFRKWCADDPADQNGCYEPCDGKDVHGRRCNAKGLGDKYSYKGQTYADLDQGILEWPIRLTSKRVLV